MLSWYPKVQIPKLYSLRDGAAEMLEKNYAEINRLAITMVSWYSPYEYTPILDDDGNMLAPTSIAALASSSLNSSICPYDGVAPQPTRSSSGYRHRDSGSSDGSSSHTSSRSRHAEADSARTGDSSDVLKERETAETQADPPITSAAPTTTSTPPTAPTS